MIVDFKQLPEYYKETYEKDKANLANELFKTSSSIRNIIYFTENIFIHDLFNPSLNTAKYINEDKTLSVEAELLFKNYLNLLLENNFDQSLMNGKQEDEILFFRSKYNLSNNKVKQKKKA